MRFFAPLLAFCCLLPPVALADDANSPEYWFRQLGPALMQTSYRGVFVYARGDQVHSVQIAHRYRGGQVEERLVLQDGSSGEVVRKGRDVICVLPEHGRMELNQVIPTGPFANAFASQSMPVSRWYDLELVGADRIAGYKVTKLAINSRDEQRYNHLLWLENDTGLPLKGQVLSDQGDVLEYYHFASIEIGGVLPDTEFEVRSEGREVKKKLNAPADHSAETGSESRWHVGWRPEGFEPATSPEDSRRRAVSFSDGLVSFSVFIGDSSDVRMPSGVSRIGATSILMAPLSHGKGSSTVTVVGEIPLNTARKIAASVKLGQLEAASE